MNQRVVVLTGMLSVAACGGGDGGEERDPAKCSSEGGAHCFQLPTAALIAHDGDQTVPATIGCGALEPAFAGQDVTMSGVVTDYSGSGEVAGAAITIYDDDDFTNEIGTATTAVDGTYSIVVPAGTPDILFGTLEADGYVTLHDYNGRPDLSGATAEFNLLMATEDLLTTIASLVDVERDPALSVLAGVALDCDRLALEHAAFVVSSTSGERDFIDGAHVFYTAAGDLPLPVPAEDRGDTNDNGVISAVNLPSSALFVQIWGFADEAAVADGEDGLTLVAEYPLQPEAGEAIGFNAFANE